MLADSGLRLRVSVLLAIVFVGLLGPGVLHAQEDPFPLVSQNPVLIDFDNPYPAWGDVIGVDAYADGWQLLVLWENGNVGRYSADFGTELDTFQTALDPTDISEVPPEYGQGGTIAVTDALGGVYFFADDHTCVGSTGINGEILAFTWDSGFQRALVGNRNGLWEVDDGGELAQLHPTSTVSMEAIDMHPEYFDMVTTNPFFNQFHPDGTINFPAGGMGTSYGEGTDMHGMAFTQTHGYVAAAGFVVRYEKAAFQDHMSYQVSASVEEYAGDLDEDGDVDIDDWSLLGSQVGTTCP